MKTQTMALVVVMLWCVLTAGICQAGPPANGTIKKNGLVWLKNANCFGAMDWNSAMSAAKNLKSGNCGLNDDSKAGDWRLPTKDELASIYVAKSEFSNVQASGYWSSTTYVYNTNSPGYTNNTNFAWFVGMGNGYIGYDGKVYNAHVWPVRGGQ